jgi:hypothetical protein
MNFIIAKEQKMENDIFVKNVTLKELKNTKNDIEKKIKKN